MDRNMNGGGLLDHIDEQGPFFASWQWLVVFLQLVADLAVYEGGMSSHGPYQSYNYAILAAVGFIDIKRLN